MTKKRITPAEPTHTSQPEQGSGRGVVEKLVTFQSEREFDVFSGQVEERLFLKLYVAARTSGLLGEISDRDWKTLCVLATYMNAEGFCHPSQAELARALGCSRQMANERVNHLAQFRFHGKPVLLVVKEERSERGTWRKNRYRVLPLSQLSIFNGEPAPPVESNDPATVASEEDAPLAPRSTVSRNLDTVTPAASAVSSPTVTVPLDTNKNQLKNQNSSNSNIRKGHIPIVSTNAVQEGEPVSSIGVEEHDMEPVGTLLAQRVPSHHAQPYDDVRGVIVAYLQDFARELNDQAPLTSSVTRAYHLYQRANTDVNGFIAAMYAARSRTQERSGSIRSTAEGSGRPVKAKMAFWFACLEDELGLREES